MLVQLWITTNYFIFTEVNGEDSVATAALRDIEERKANVGPVVADSNTKSTVVIHASRKVRIFCILKKNC